MDHTIADYQSISNIPEKIRPCIRNPALTRFYEKIGLEMRWTSLSINHRREKNDTSTTPEV